MPVPAVRCPPEVCLICTKGWKIFFLHIVGDGMPVIADHNGEVSRFFSFRMVVLKIHG